jgi:hypothetical protein
VGLCAGAGNGCRTISADEQPRPNSSTPVPCSYLIYSKGFADLPAEVKAYMLKRFHAMLTGEDKSAAFTHLTPADRKAVLEILRDTLPDLPAYWKK